MSEGGASTGAVCWLIHKEEQVLNSGGAVVEHKCHPVSLLASCGTLFAVKRLKVFAVVVVRSGMCSLGDCVSECGYVL